MIQQSTAEKFYQIQLKRGRGILVLMGHLELAKNYLQTLSLSRNHHVTNFHQE